MVSVAVVDDRLGTGHSRGGPEVEEHSQPALEQVNGQIICRGTHDVSGEAAL